MIDAANPTGVDARGFIVTEVSLANIPAAFAPIVADVHRTLRENLASSLASIYLYGSVVTGRARVGISDLDVLLIFQGAPDDAVRATTERLAADLSLRYEHTLREVRLAVTSRDELLGEAERHGLRCFVKHLCVRLDGEDLTRGVEPFRPTIEVARAFNGDIAAELASYRAKLKKLDDARARSRVTRSLAKKIVRTGFSLVMPRAGRWTTDLRASRDAFVELYPAHRGEMDQALDWAENGAPNAEAVIQFIDGFGRWLTEEFARVIGLRA